MTLTKPINLGDGRTLTSHAIVEKSLDVQNNRVALHIGSWVSDQEQSSGVRPAKVTVLDVALDAWDAEAFGDGSAIVSSHPDWTGSGPQKPSSKHVWMPFTGQWKAPDSVPIESLRAAKWADIKAAREAIIDAPLATPYGAVDSKPRDRTNITDSVLMLQTLAAMGQPTTIDFTMADNSTVTLDTSQMVAVGLLLGQKVQAAHARARTLRTAIEAATTPQEIEAIAW